MALADVEWGGHGGNVPSLKNELIEIRALLTL
jgi:hypothetical protein